MYFKLILCFILGLMIQREVTSVVERIIILQLCSICWINELERVVDSGIDKRRGCSHCSGRESGREYGCSRNQLQY